MLNEREEIHEDSNDWIIQEAMNINHLQTGGTFKNVLARRLDEVVIPCFARIVTILDQNSNLSLLQPVRPLSFLSHFWLNIFGSQRVQEELHFEDLTRDHKVPMEYDGFACTFPFFWLVKDLIDSQWELARSVEGNLIIMIISCFKEGNFDLSVLQM